MNFISVTEYAERAHSTMLRNQMPKAENTKYGFAKNISTDQEL